MCSAMMIRVIDGLQDPCTAGSYLLTDVLDGMLDIGCALLLSKLCGISLPMLWTLQALQQQHVRKCSVAGTAQLPCPASAGDRAPF